MVPSSFIVRSLRIVKNYTIIITLKILLKIIQKLLKRENNSV